MTAGVGAACPGTARWRALGRASNLLCPLHRQQMAVLRPRSHLPVGPLSSVPLLQPTRTHGRCSTCGGPPGRPSRSSIATSATLYPGLLAAVTASATQSSASLSPALVAVVPLLPNVGTFLLCLAASIFLIASLPAIWALARTAHRAERLLAVLEAELPDTIASMRLAGLEVTDCIQELGALGGEVTRGVRSAAALATAAEAGVRGGVAAADYALQSHVVPAVARAESGARGAVESHLAVTSRLSYTAPVVAQAAAATTGVVRRLRAGLAVGNLVGAAVQAGRSARESLVRQQQQEAWAAQKAPRAPRPDSDADLRRQLEEDERALRQELEALREVQRQKQKAQQQGQQRKGR